jgi:transposase InsO family protein
MPWSETSPMEERARFVLEALERRFTMTELCYRYGISRKTGYKWLERYQGGGGPACRSQSRAPKSHPNATDPRIADRLIKFRKKHPYWGPITLRSVLAEKYPKTPWPSPSTIGAILKKAELVRKRRRRLPRAVWRPARTEADRPNRVWTADFKGQFRLGNGELCYPLTIVDAYSRYLLVCRALKGTGALTARRGFEDAFREFGLPEVIRTDNGVPFCGPGSVLGLSTLSVWFLKLGIRLERSRPGKPQDNGAHERMHRTLKEEAVQPARQTQAAQQRALSRFRRIYNEERPHHALELKKPASLYRSSERVYPADLPDPVYQAHFEQRRITKIGIFSWKQHQIFVTEALRHETLGFEPIADGLWSVFFGDVLLGRFSEQDNRFTAGSGR